jgi:eukaryotic-like serine/threonine-protein kinase
MSAYANWDAHGAPELETLLELGEGGMAVAYLARTLGAGGFQRLVVLKRLGLSLAQSRDAIDRFLAEARLAASVHHANVVGTHRVGRDAAGPYIVLDYVEGGSLDDLLQAALERDEVLPVPALLRIALDALYGLEAVHEARDTNGRRLAILHRDVSLQNVLVSVRDGVTRLSDFGVAKSTLSRVETSPGVLVGKLLYFSPEYLLHEPTGPALDIYALGVMLWLALTGEDPWPTEHGDEPLIRAIVEEGVPPLPRDLELAPEIRELVATACARDPRERFSTAREMAAVIERFDRERGWVASHHEVADLVQRLLGRRLQARRDFIAELAPQLEPTRLRELALAPTRRERDLVKIEPRSEPPRVRSQRFYRRGLVWVGAGATAFVLAAALALLSGSEPTPHALVPVPQLAGTRETGAEPALPPRAPQPSVEPLSSASDPVTPHSTLRAPDDRRAPAVAAPRPRHPDRQAPTRPGTTGVGSEIKRQNPYR